MTQKSKLHRGDEVSWKSSQGTIHGTVKKKVEHDTQIKGHQVKASKSDPQYLVESARTGAKAAHKPESLSKK